MEPNNNEPDGRGAERCMPGWTREPAAPLAEVFAGRARRTPDAVAVDGLGGPISYGELAARANRLSHHLRAEGVCDGDSVAISIERSPEMLVAVLGVLGAGGVCVPVDPAYPVARREYMLKDSGARRVIVAGGSGEASHGVRAIDLRFAADQIATRPDSALETAATGATLAYLIYTSGSTGEPKGVMLPQRALTNLVAWQIARPGFGWGARTLQFASLSFDVSFQELFATWASGGTIVLIDDVRRRDPRTLLEHIEAFRVDRVFLPFVALRGLAVTAVRDGRFPACLREVYTAGEQLQVDDALRRFFEALPSCLLENQYGPSEAHVVTAHRLEGPPASWPVLPPIGRAIANTELAILDERLREADPGEAGELFIGGTCLADGYLGKPDKTAERFVDVERPGAGKTRMYRTGDLAERTPEGEIRFLGRVDQQVKIRGHRVEPGEVSTVLAAHETVGECVVAVRSGRTNVPRLVAFVVPKPGHEFRPAVLAGYARSLLPDYMVPAQIVALDALPLTPSGKVAVAALPNPEVDRTGGGAEYAAPRTADELALVRIWCDVLGVSDIGIRDDFFDLGGDSIVAVRVLEAVREEFGVDVTLGTLAAGPTIEAFARNMRPGAEAARWRSLVPIRTGGGLTPLFCVHGGMGNVGSFPRLARQLPDDQPFYGLQWDGLTGDDGTRTIEAMAARYLREIRSVQTSGPYLLAGHCIGGLIAAETARLLAAQGERVEMVFLIDSPNLASPRFRRSRRPSGLEVLWKMRKDRRTLVEIWMRRALGRAVRPEQRGLLAVRVMVRAAWKHVPVPPEVPTTALVTGLKEGASMSLAGSWDDDAMGWSTWVGPILSVQRVAADHGDVVYVPATAEILCRELERAHARISGTVATHP
ncbi:hypothetical protein ASA1KI_44260 [Opitutales bacterium ASA1]|uniref:amino acid adenylation domain-containing protein n=1 Tax=Congregicoccus parvus TaxID=3081749 RepID=UPI002B27E62C|nr:hypothetical protein ASA1KI_44260 [Opitutales bacterium ASA1]